VEKNRASRRLSERTNLKKKEVDKARRRAGRKKSCSSRKGLHPAPQRIRGKKNKNFERIIRASTIERREENRKKAASVSGERTSSTPRPRPKSRRQGSQQKKKGGWICHLAISAERSTDPGRLTPRRKGKRGKRRTDHSRKLFNKVGHRQQVIGTAGGPLSPARGRRQEIG